MGSALDACHAAVDYAYPWQLLLQRFKYSDSGDLTAQPSLAHCLAYVMKEVARQDASLQAALREAQKSWLIPVPLHPDRQRERGFNQASALAHALFPGHPRLDGDLLLRVKNTAIQANLPRDSRAHNLRHAFAVPPSKVGILKGESVILIDDVATTTATISAAAAALRQVGVKEIRALVMARAV